ncbi:O-linked N-acetylglucosamine transferase, SPINDLY family protein [Phormidium sp. CCY1219]|uniref:O-linked N-acetylglucosamine transferase, SPINDLY family protein n=1 Tax=Phormidium sp. CCY1219 TaxID=2886104 RepID=UPI002D1E63A0|nr:tetratricopeptide repeat protein [Phormidium sp. CCY1219]MEB3829798.1 tetratricopeptide repeat protein [Phormidium sp. CCY1219]
MADAQSKPPPLSIAALYAAAVALDRAGDWQGAQQKYRQLLHCDRHHADGLQNLAMIYYRQGQFDDALALLEECIAIHPATATAHYRLGLIWAKVGYLDKAIAAFKRAISLDPQFLRAYHQLGKTWMELGNFALAQKAFRDAIARECNQFISYLYLGNCLLADRRFEEAIATYETALQLKPRDPQVIQQIGIALTAQNRCESAELYFGYAAYRQQNYDAAIAHYRQFLTHKIGDIPLYLALADCYQCRDRTLEAIEIYREALRHYPTALELYLSLMLALQNVGKVEAARVVAEEGLQWLPENRILQLEKLRLLPILYDTPEQVDLYRARFARELDTFLAEVSLETVEAKQQALRAIGTNTNFYLQYQGKNDLRLQQHYGEFVHRVMGANYPQWVEPLPMPELTGEGKIKIGYLSACFQWHTVGMVFWGWLQQCDRASFEIYGYDIATQSDGLTQQFRQQCDRFYSIPNDLEALADRIRGDELHILVFLEIGMYAPMTQLAGLRLAPIQCAAWGHPITSGLPTVDYFISSNLMEPENAAQHYSETLVRLPNIGICYSKPTIPEARHTRADFGLRQDAVVYLCCQSVFKYLPQFDVIFPQIAREVPEAQFVFFAQKSTAIAEQFRQRLRRAFAQFGLDSQAHCTILPRQSKEKYWNILSVADIFLDTFGFSGFLTVLEAVAVALPVVTCAGEFMRSRQSAGICRRIGVTETLAENEADFVRIAIQLGLDANWRNAIRTRIKQQNTVLYDDTTAVMALEKFYREAVEKWNSSPG